MMKNNLIINAALCDSNQIFSALLILKHSPEKKGIPSYVNNFAGYFFINPCLNLLNFLNRWFNYQNPFRLVLILA